MKSHRNACILIVDDDLDLRDMMAELLNNEGYRTMTVPSAREALHRMENVLPDLVITDLMMPEMDGTELLQAIDRDERWSAIPVMMLTAAGELMAKRALAAAGLSPPLLGKPIRVNEFLDLVDGCLELGARHERATPEALAAELARGREPNRLS